MHDYFGGEGYEYLFALSHGGGRQDRGSLPFKRGGDGDGILLGLLRHEVGGGGVLGVRESFYASWRCFSCVLWAVPAVK